MGPYNEDLPDLNYFTCTLDEAAELNSRKPHQYETINEFIDFQALHNGTLPAVAFPPGGAAGSTTDVFTYTDLRCGSVVVAHELASLLSSNFLENKSSIALLCQSSVDFLFAWLGLMRCGYSVLLIAPQCQPAAIAQLCMSCNASHLFFDQRYEKLARAAAQLKGANFTPHEFPWQKSTKGIVSLVRDASMDIELSSKTHHPRPLVKSTDVAYIFHTSGTSTGLPKPIPQTHNAAIGVLPYLAGSDIATFTTTPLYHGGIADCFRAWSSNSLIWLFPAASQPITSKTIIDCLSIAKNCSDTRAWMPLVKYFASVPYILQILSEDLDGLRWLRNMDIVGVGGAALPPAVGDKLVSEGVNLVSRFGSAECGFLLSSHRNYKIHKDWQYLGFPPESKYLKLVPCNDDSGLSELIVLNGWPIMAKTNRLNGDFATNDLFEPHPSHADSWRYHSRSDSQITLVTGKKFDPAPIEDALTSSSAAIRDVLIFGNGKQFPGALIFPTKYGKELAEDQLRNEVWNKLNNLNEKGQDHTRIPANMVIFVPRGTETLAKSSKGTVLRGAEESRFEKEIERAYVQDDLPATRRGGEIKVPEVLRVVRNLVLEVLGQPSNFDNEADFFHSGVDSTKATQIRSLLQQEFAFPGLDLPWNIVYDGGNVNQLAQLLIDLQRGHPKSRDELAYMLDVAERFSSSIFDVYNASPSLLREKEDEQRVYEKLIEFAACRRGIYNKYTDTKTVILTGATGSLGANILDLLQNKAQYLAVDRIICLVRASSVKDARHRVNESLRKRRKCKLTDPRIVCLPADLGQDGLGLNGDGLLRVLKSNRSSLVIIHAAWNVNFSLPLESFIHDQIAGLVNLLRFSEHLDMPTRFIFCSSTASVLGSGHPKTIRESISKDPKDSGALGYSKSKWVAESICREYVAKQTGANTMAVLRIGQLTGDTENGVWNMTEAWPLMLSTVKQLECLPDLDEILSWLPVDVAAQAILQIAVPVELVHDEKIYPHPFYDPVQLSDDQDCPVYHLVNNSTATRWKDLLQWLKLIDGVKFETVEPSVWLDRLEQLETHPAKALLGLWKNAYGKVGKRDAESSEKEDPAPPSPSNVLMGFWRDIYGKVSDIVAPGKRPMMYFETEQTTTVAEVMRSVGPVNEQLVKKIWTWMEGEIAPSKPLEIRWPSRPLSPAPPYRQVEEARQAEVDQRC